MTKKKPKKFPPPKFVYKPPPKFRSKQEELSWLSEERRRWKEGYEGLTGPHYFYLTQFFIKVGVAQDVQRPEWRDCDQYIFEEIDKAMQNGEDLLWISRREIGKSSIIACMAVWTMRVFPGSTSILTSSNKDKIHTLFSEKIYEIYDGDYLHPFVQGTKAQHSNTQNKMYLKILYQVRDAENKIKNKYSQLVCVETNETPKSPTNMSSKRAKFVAIDEIGLHERRQAVLSSSENTMTEGGKRVGFRMLAGTIEKDIPASSVAELQKLVANKDKLKIRVIFTPYWAGANLVNGHSDVATSEKEWKERFDRLSSMDDKTALNAFLKNEPPDLETALSVGGKGVLPEEVLAAVGHQDRLVQNDSKKPVHRGFVVPSQGTETGYDFVTNKNEGSWFITEFPQLGEEYISGMDPIPFNTNNMSEENSRYVTIIMKKSNREIVAINKDRSADPDDIYRKISNGLKYYNGAKSMLETNAGRTMYDRFKTNGTLHLLAREPRRIPAKTKGLDGYGFWKTPNMDDYLTELLIKYLLDNSDKLWFNHEKCNIFQEIPFYLLQNTDIISALLACLIYLDELDRSSKTKQSAKRKFKDVKILVQTPQGMMPKYIKVPIHGNNSKGID